MPKRAVIIGGGINGCIAAQRNCFWVAVLCAACCLMPWLPALYAQENNTERFRQQNDEELFRGTVVKTGSLSVNDLGKILGVSLIGNAENYPCRIKAMQPVSLAVSSNLAIGDNILSAVVAERTLTLTVNRSGQVFRLTTEIPYYNKSLTGGLASRHTPLPVVPSLHLSANQDNLLSVLSQPGRRSSMHPRKRAECSCVDNSWCTDQCPRAPYCNCPSIARANPDATCSWSGPNSKQTQDTQAWLNRLHGQAQNVQSQRRALEQEILGR